jgi:CO/xanthine dehydrogenase Mo-binding subunit
VRPDDAIKTDAPRVLEQEANLTQKAKQGELPAVHSGFRKLWTRSLREEYRTPRIHHACLETHGMVVDYRGGDSATVYATTQGTFSIPVMRQALSACPKARSP